MIGTMFNEIKVPRYAENSTTVRELVKVPISLGNKDKTLARVFADPGAEARPQAVTLPRMSFEMTGMRYDPNRRVATLQSIVLHEAGYERLYVPVTYDFDFDLHVYSKTQEDGLKIVEQIVPFFTPEFSVRVELIPNAVTLNIPVILRDEVQCADDYAQGNIKDRRAVVWTLPLTLKGVLFGPKRETGIIKFVDAPFYVPQWDKTVDETTRFNTGAIDRVTVQPGMDANGHATTNAAASIPFADIELEDDWAYAVTIAGNLDPTEGTGGADEPIED